HTFPPFCYHPLLHAFPPHHPSIPGPHPIVTAPRVIIIGGGVAGLGAALRLARSGRFRPLILEREREPGGLARSLHFKGLSTDLGPHRLHTELPEVEDLFSEACAPSLYTVQRRSRIYL